jgi:hypothetical protein
MLTKILNGILGAMGAILAFIGGALWGKREGKRQLYAEQSQQTLKEAINVKEDNEKHANHSFDELADELREFEVPTNRKC